MAARACRSAIRPSVSIVIPDSKTIGAFGPEPARRTWTWVGSLWRRRKVASTSPVAGERSPAAPVARLPSKNAPGAAAAVSRLSALIAPPEPRGPCVEEPDPAPRLQRLQPKRGLSGAPSDEASGEESLHSSQAHKSSAAMAASIALRMAIV